MNLTRKQELVLIDLGLRWLLEHLPSDVIRADGEILPTENKKVQKPKRKKRKWSPEQHKKFAETMKKVWERRKKKQPKQ